MDEIYYIGFISGPFGIKGEVKLISDTNLADKVFKVGNKLYIDDVAYKISNYHIHKNNHLITFEGYEDINKLDNFFKKDVYVNIKELNLNDDEYLYVELLGYKIVDNDIELGVVEDILLSKKDFYIKNGNLIIPMIPTYLIKVDKINKIIYVNNTKELRL